ncbi:MAG: hypothetical protein WA823_16485 [Candidatus Acidiferrales bacterium]
MGAKLLAVYEHAQKELGAPGRMRIAILTSLSSIKAGDAPDSPENLKLFQDAMAKLGESETGKH